MRHTHPTMPSTASETARPRSLVFDLFGQYVDRGDDGIRLQALTRLLECFDVPGDSVRVLMSRLRAEGWFETVRNGRSSVYTPTAAGWRLLEEGMERITERSQEVWHSRWHMVIFSVPESQRAARVRIRKRLAWLGFGPLAPSTWLSPHDRLAEVRALFAEEPTASFDVMLAMSTDPAEDRLRAARCWDLDGLARDYRAYIKRWEAKLRPARAGRTSPRDALIRRVQVVHEYRLFLFRDPDLPVQLLPPDWPGHRAQELMLEALELLREPAMAFYRQSADGRAS